MGINDISLTSGMRNNLISLQHTGNLLDRTQERLATGKSVNEAIDDPVNYFAAKSHTSRAGDLDIRRDGMHEAIQTADAAQKGIEAITTIIGNMKGLIQAARSADATNRDTLSQQFDELRDQIDNLANDASYKGTNLLQSDTLTVKFNEAGDTSMDVVGFDADTTGLAIDAAANAWATDADMDAAEDDLNAALDVLRTEEAKFATNLSVITIRREFTSNMINTLTIGADNLTLADTDEEGANMLMLETRQALGHTSLSLSSQAAQSILRLF